MRVLVTGGGGSIGVHLVRALTARGDMVTVVDNFNDFYDPAFKRFRFQNVLANVTAPTVAEIDLIDAHAVRTVMEEVRPDRVVHLAAWPSVQVSIRQPLLYTQQNVLGTVNVFEAAVAAHVGGVVFASSSSVYGRTTAVPFREDARCDVPLAPYGASKRAGELYASMYHYLHGLPVTCLRFFTVYGPWIRPDMAPWKLTEKIMRGEPIELRTKAPNGDEVKRDFTYIDDIVSGVLAAIDRVRGFDIVNVGHDDPVSLPRFVRAIEQGTGKQATVREVDLGPEEAIVTAADLTHARDVLGYEPTVSIEDGMKRVAEWYAKEFVPAFPNGLQPSPY